MIPEAQVKSYSPWLPKFLVSARREMDYAWRVLLIEAAFCRELVQQQPLNIRIAGGTGAGPDEIGWLLHRLS